MNSFQEGTLQVTAINSCGKTVSRTFLLSRVPPPPPPLVPASSSSSCVQCFTAPAGSGYSWTVFSGSSGIPTTSFYIDGSTTSRTACVRSRIGPGGGYVRVSYNGGCGGTTPLTAGSVFTIALNCFGGRLSAENLDAVAESVSPNPAADVLTITHPSEKFEIILTDMLGRQVRRHTGTHHRQSLDVAALPDGLYLLQLRGEGETKCSKHRIVVAH